MLGTTPAQCEVTGGIDTHADTHTVAVLDQLGHLLGHATFPATGAGYAQLLDWLSKHGDILEVGVEGTGSYGAGLARHLTSSGIKVVEVDRPDRRARRQQGKSDPVDAVAAARAVQAGTATGIPKARDGVVESIRALRVARNGAIKAHTAAINTLQQMIITAPTQLRKHLTGLGPNALVDTCARLRPRDLHEPTQAMKAALTTVRQDFGLLGEMIMQKVLVAIEEPDTATADTPLPTRLILRQSTRPVL